VQVVLVRPLNPPSPPPSHGDGRLTS
jgi:hypothetical protein